jgi:ribosomal protein S18 acetylase RimI-like enzyme
MAGPTRISLRSLAEKDTQAMSALLAAQDARLHELDRRLRLPRSGADWTENLREHRAAEALVVEDARGRLRAVAVPAIWELSPDSETMGFYRPRTGVARVLALPDPAEADSVSLVDLLLDALERWWREHKAGGAYLNWPSADGLMGGRLIARGFDRDITAAIRPLDTLPPAIAPAGVVVRLARPEDEEVLVRLHLEEIRFHEAYSPHIRVVPGMEIAFRERLNHIWCGESVADGASLVLVASRNGEMLGFTENWLSSMPGGWFRTGGYGYLNSVGVRADARGQGIGRLLAAVTCAALSQYEIEAYTLYFAYNNPLSSRFWPRLGFRPLVDSYKRHYEPRTRTR